ncbi:MAG: hypothetical protein WD048_02110 [Chitinophagales bacterium]
MEKAQLIELLKYPAQSGILEKTQLETALEQYPYCNSLHLLAAKKARLLNKQNQADLLFNAALHACDRKQLYYFIETETAQQKNTSDKQNIEQDISPDLIDSLKKGASSKTKEKAVAQKKAVSEVKNTSPKVQKTAEQPVEKTKAAVPEKKKKAKQDKASEYSFIGWLNFVKNNKTTIEQEDHTQEEVQEMDDQIKAHAYEAELIKTAAELKDVADKKSKAEDQKNEVLEKDVDEMARKSSDEQQSNITETLAIIFENQNKYTKAIEAYEFLSLKYPEKSSFFAGKIENLKNKL